MTLVKVCPKCGYQNDPSELYCLGMNANAECGYGIALTPITVAGGQTPTSAQSSPIPSPTNPLDLSHSAEESSSPDRCINGHPIDAGDAICIECGAGRAEAAEQTTRPPVSNVRFHEHYEIVRPLDVVSGEADLYLCQRTDAASCEEAPGEPAQVVIKHYRHGFNPNAEVLSKLQSLKSDYCLTPLDVGRVEDRVYEAYEYLAAGTLADIPESTARQTDYLMAVVSQIAAGLADLHVAELLHRDLKPANVLMRSIQPPRIALSDFGAAAVSQMDVHVTSSRQTTRYAAPESFAGVTSSASDWWSLGMIILELLAGRETFAGVDERAFILSIIARPMVIPSDIPERWQLLLKGLLTRDHTLRWGFEQVSAWLGGDDSLRHFFEDHIESAASGASISLGGKSFHSPERYALAAGLQENWSLAVVQLSTGELGTWLAEDKLDEVGLQHWQLICDDVTLSPDQRLMLGLLVLNPQIPLCFVGEIITPNSFPATADRSLQWLESSIPEHLGRLGRELWLVELSNRRNALWPLLRKLDLQVEQARLDALALISSTDELQRQWAMRQAEFPEPRNAMLMHWASRHRPADAELVVLLAAPWDEFRSADEILAEAHVEAARADLQEIFDVEKARQLLRQGRSQVIRSLSELLTDFVRCGYATADEWADTFRFDNRISLARALVLLAVPPERWQRPEGGIHWQRLLDFFRRKVLSTIQRGPLLSLRISQNSARLDIAELGTDAMPAATLLDAILSQDGLSVDPGLLAKEPVLQRRLRRLRNNADNYQRDTGISSLYLGFPVLVRRDQNAGQTVARFVPLLLWPIRLHYPDGQQTSANISADREQERVQLNPAYALSLDATQKQVLVNCLTEIASRSTITAGQVVELISQLYQDQSVTVESEFAELPAEPRLEDGSDGRLITSGVLFQCDFAGQELADELERMQQLPFAHSPAANLLRLQPTAIEPLPPLPSAEERFLVTAADPSQESATFAARQPPGLLIQGPPGTGKSQTIVNIVADAIARNKTVLVVCQKQAALDVVGHRLEASGLGDRLAMIGDPTKDRRPFLQRLRNQLDSPARGSRESAAAHHRIKAHEVAQLESEIDGVHEAMTRVIGKSGLTYEQVISELIGIEKSGKVMAAPTIRSQLAHLHVGEVQAAARQIEHYGPLWITSRFEGSPLHCLKSFSPDAENLNVFKTRLDAFMVCEQRRDDQLGSGRSIDINRLDIPSITHWLNAHEAELANTHESILRAMKVWVDQFESGLAEAEMQRLEAIAVRAQANTLPDYEIRLRTRLGSLNDKQIQTLYRDARRVLSWHKSWMRSLWPAYHLSRQRLQRMLELESSIIQADIANLVAVLKYESVARTCSRDFERCRSNLKLDSTQVNLSAQQVVEKAQSLVASLQSAKRLMHHAESCPQRSDLIATLKTGEPGQLRMWLQSMRHGILLSALREESLKSLAALNTWIEASEIDQLHKSIFQGNTATQWCRAMEEHWHTVRDFQTFRLRCVGLTERERIILAELAHLRPALEALPEGEAAGWMGNVVYREALLAWREMAERQTPGLLMERDEFGKRLNWLRQASVELNKAVLALVPTLPQPNLVAARTAWDDLVMYTGPRAKKLREVVGMGRELGLYQLRPVWLASPLSVSRLFPLQQGLFDLVIFDEASQLPVEYALPAIYRGKAVIVSGDDKQLPPTKFFATAFDEDDSELPSDEEAEDEVAGRESRREVKDCTDLLELAAPVFPKVMLNVHYRSRYRQLIDFSNAAFYDRRLSVPVLHPLEKIREAQPIQFIEVNGLYENQSNCAEADQVVSTLREWWSGSDLDSTPTVGVVTFNLKQAELIEDKLAALAEEDSNFREMLQRQRDRKKDGEHCGFFVKNVENVQGDERDCIIFSTTFGKNPRGVFLRNFGVLGQSGGERRLNVAVTRAKDRMLIFSSMPLERISDIQRGQSVPHTPRDHLQAYLLYAKAVSDQRYDEARRILDLFGSSSSLNSGSHAADTPFISEVQSYLEQQGWKVERPVANDAFRFDLAIRRPDDGMFAIAINCDSPRHADLRFARHRELWRSEVLRSSVSHIHRVWSRSWLTDPEKEKQRLLAAVNGAMEAKE